MKTRLILAMLILCLLYVNISNAQNSRKPYVNDEYKYSIVFPDDWIIEPGLEKYKVVNCQTPETGQIKQGCISIKIQPADNQDLNSFFKKKNIELKQDSSISFLLNKKDKVMLNGKEFNLYDYNFESRYFPERLRNINYLYLLNKKIYIISFWGSDSFYEKNKEIIMKSIESFKFLE